jgi:crossover junction endodeoxyribonuclease RuvC
VPIILGVDPGVTGAMVWLQIEPLEILTVLDHEVWCYATEPDEALYHLLGQQLRPDLTVVEAQHARATMGPDGKRQQGIASTWNYAEHYGIIKGCVRQYRCPVRFPDPAVWKANMKLSRDKKKSLAKARQLFPNHTDLFERVKDHGRAEAALLAWYGQRHLELMGMPVSGAGRKRVL